MTSRMIIEGIGYVGSALILGSMLMTSVTRLRIINLIGSAVFACYALMIHSIPTAIINIGLVVINIVQLKKLADVKREYDLVKVDPKEAGLQYLLQHYYENIVKYFPTLKAGIPVGDIAFMVYCNGSPAGIFLGTQREDGVIDVDLDYSTPRYRDSSVGRFFYGKLPEQGVKQLVFRNPGEKHRDYMLRIGFKETEKDTFVKFIKAPAEEQEKRDEV
ncbi:MAG: hypothetical protein IKT15_00565 [Firmicutes bacterium]|nr:hypothetical protein [Bacillota bacterium]